MRGLTQSHPGEATSKNGDKARTPGANRPPFVWGKRQVEDHPLLGSCKQINHQWTMQYLGLSVHDQTQFFKNFARWRTSSCCLACVQLVPQGEGTRGNISVGSFQLTIYSQNYVVSEQLKVFFYVGGLLTIVFNVTAGTPKVSKFLFLSDKRNISLHRPFSETINKRQ